MKSYHMNMKLKQTLASLITILIVATSCTYFAPNKAKLEAKMEERTRELNSGALIATREAQQQIQATKSAINTGETNFKGDVTIIKTNFNQATQHLGQASSAVQLAENFLTRNENLQGKPIEDQTEVVKSLLGENIILRTEAQLMEKYRQSQEQSWSAKQAEYERKLENYGQKYEQERNEKITRWLKWGSIIFALIAIPIAICVFFPPALGLLAGIFPKLVGAFGVTTVKAASNISRAVGDIRWDFKKTSEVAPDKTFTAAEVQAIMDGYLKEHVDDDRATRNVVEYLREKNNT